MMHMMNNTGWGFGLPTLWGIHILSVIAFFVGILFLMYWSFQHLTPAQLKRWGWTLIIGISIACLLTIGVMGHPWAGYGMGNYGSGRMMPMMGNWQNQQQNEENASQQKEEADGKVLYDTLQAKQTTCSDLSDDDFELIGEYLMGQHAGANHEQMNVMIKQMMGDDAPMHIFLAKNATGCATGTQSSQPNGGMMNGGGMMQRQGNSSSRS